MELIDPLAITRRHFFSTAAKGLGVMALGSLLPNTVSALAEEKGSAGLPGLPHFAPKAKRVVYLFQSGAPSQMDLFDHKPKLADLRATELVEYRPYGIQVVQLNEGAAVVTYDVIIRMARYDEDIPRYQHISSVWVKLGEQWKLRFQQATAAQ